MIEVKAGMSKNEFNNRLDNKLELIDDVYLGVSHKHNWKCKCGEIYSRKFDKRYIDKYKCDKCKYIDRENNYKLEVEKDNEYEYIKAYFNGDMLPNGKVIGKNVYIQVRHKYCGSIYETQVGQFINNKIRCGKCCGSYEKSFAHHIEVELGLKLEDVWDFEKNTVNPYYISKGTDMFVIWIRCQNEEINELNGLMKKDYHGSYEIAPYHFKIGCRCPLCNTFASKKVHTYDSFGYHNFNKTQSWHPDNDISPFRVACGSAKKYKFICWDCGEVFLKQIGNMHYRDEWCPVCSASKGEKKVGKWLNYNNFNYIHDKPYFNDLLSDLGNPLRPDFILPEQKIWIEYDGEMHYETTNLNNNLEKQKYHDELKNSYAKEHNWKLIRIPYWEFDNIEEILFNTIKKKN